jgi:hypothetical protein
MRSVLFLMFLFVAGCDKFPESTFVLAPGSPIPAGLESGPELEGVSDPRIEIWIYSSGNAAVAKVFNGQQLVVEVPGTWRWGTTKEAPAEFFVTINSVETGFSRTGLNNVINALPSTRPTED